MKEWDEYCYDIGARTPGAQLRAGYARLRGLEVTLTSYHRYRENLLNGKTKVKLLADALEQCNERIGHYFKRHEEWMDWVDGLEGAE